MSLSFCSRPAEVCSLGVHPLLCVSEYLLIRLISYHYWLTLAVSPCFLASSVSNLFYVNGEETDIDTLTHILSLPFPSETEIIIIQFTSQIPTAAKAGIQGLSVGFQCGWKGQSHVSHNHHFCFPEFALAGIQNQEMELGVKSWPSGL